MTSMIGQDVPPSLAGIFHAGHPVASAETMVKEAVKRILARGGNAKYAMHGPNRALRPVRLRDGQGVSEFLRCNPHWGGVSCGDTGSRLEEVLSEGFLDRLVRREGVCILYTHLGKVRSGQEPFGEPARTGLRRLAAYQAEGRILVTTTSRLLRYLSMCAGLQYRCDRLGDRLVIEIARSQDGGREARPPLPDEIQGLTFEVAWPGDAEVRWSGGPAVLCRQVRSGGQLIISVPWRSLVFPDWRAST